MKSFLFDFRNAFTNYAVISRKSWPWSRNALPRKWPLEQASRQISEVSMFAVNANSCFCVNFFTSTLPEAPSVIR